MKHRILGLLAVAGINLAPSANALTISQSQNINGSSGSVSFDFFDQSLGVLTGLEISASGTANQEFNVIADCPRSDCSASDDISLTASIGSFALGTIEIADSDTKSGTITCSASEGETNSCSRRFLISLSATDSATDQSTLDLFTGAGTFTIPFSTSSSHFPEPLVGLASVTYTYRAVAEVPEPATLALLGLGLLGLGVTRRRGTA